MTTQVEEIRDLIEKIKAGELPEEYSLSALGAKPFRALPFSERLWAAYAYSGNLSAAQKLHEALLRSRRFELESYGKFCECAIIDGINYYGEAENLARAWLIAILKAYAAQVEGEE